MRTRIRTRLTLADISPARSGLVFILSGRSRMLRPKAATAQGPYGKFWRSADNDRVRPWPRHAGSTDAQSTRRGDGDGEASLRLPCVVPENEPSAGTLPVG